MLICCKYRATFFFLQLMKLCLLTVGKTDIGWVREGLETYVSRLSHYVPFSVKEIPELKNVSSLSRQQIKDKEGELILGNLVPSDMVILLDEHGKEHSSVEFARQIESWTASSGKNIVFVIGGAYGFSDAVYADYKSLTGYNATASSGKKGTANMDTGVDYSAGTTLYGVILYTTTQDSKDYYMGNVATGVVEGSADIDVGGLSQAIFGTSYATAWSTAAVPEPTSGLLMLLGMAGLALRRRRA